MKKKPPLPALPLFQSRRRLLQGAGGLLGCAAMAGIEDALLSSATARAVAGMRPSLPEVRPRAKRVIYLFMAGGPPQMDLWDYKPLLAKRFNEDLPPSVRGNQVLTGMTSGQARLPVAPSKYRFAQHGQSGQWLSSLFPWTAKTVDELAVIRSIKTDAINHEPAILLMNTGNMVAGKPSMGSWLSYGLGSMNEDLPAFIVLSSRYPRKANAQPISPRLWGSGFLSAEHAGVALRAGADPVLFLKDPAGMPRHLRRAMIDGIRTLNGLAHQTLGDEETNARTAQYEMAFRMQTSVPEATSLAGEPESTFSLYGPDAKIPGTFTRNCLLARRLAERGVRFIQIYHRGWDVHEDLGRMLPQLCHDVDRGCYALVSDLKRRGLLDDTLVIWGGEFGRTVYSQGTLTSNDYGRDHHARCFTMWMAGGGVRPGISFGQTDDYSYNITRDPVHVRDLDATILHLLGIDHQRLSFRFQGLDQKLTGVTPARVVEGLVA
jgi:hypothetical protein